MARGSASDALYRIFIKVKMIAQLSGGDNDAIINAAAELLGVEYSDIFLEDVYPAKIALYVDQDLLSEERLELIEQIAHAIKRALLAGVGIRMYLRTYRDYRLDLPISHGGAIGAELSTVPISQDRASRLPVSMAHGAALAPIVETVPPMPERTHTGHLDGAGGVMYHTHIESRRID